MNGGKITENKAFDYGGGVVTFRSTVRKLPSILTTAKFPAIRLQVEAAAQSQRSSALTELNIETAR